MVFSTSIFLFFFLPIVLIGYYLLKDNYRIGFLLLASLFFYAWGEPKYVLVMLFSIAVNYFFGIFIHKSLENKVLSKIFLFTAVALNLGILYYFKYFNFTIESLNRFFKAGFEIKDIVLPIGISFYLFQGMSYLIDLYWKKVEVQKNPVKLAFYISFFPQLMAGPIIRYKDIKEQINNRQESVELFISGIQRFVIGLSKKVIIANSMGATADIIFGANPSDITTPIAWLGVICYAFQIYFDFSGYSCMAIGLARMFGFKFLENFNYPYISKTLTEFWRRWHISLSSWFRDYVYIPLGGNKKGNVYLNLLIVFIVTGFWHGADWQFLAWGLWHGAFLIFERLFNLREVQNKKTVSFRFILTMLIVLIGWVFFRSTGIRYALNYISLMFGFYNSENILFSSIWFFLSPKIIIMLCIAVIASTPILGYISSLVESKNKNVIRIISYVLTIALLLLSIVFVTGSSYNPFIYFRF